MIALAAMALIAQSTVAEQTAEKPESIIAIAQKCTPAAPCEGIWNGLHYKVLANDAATFKASAEAKTSWSFSCRKDPFDDTVTCTLTGRDRNQDGENPSLFMVWTNRGRTPAISVFHSGQAYPGSLETIRVDGNTAVSVDEDDFFVGGVAERLITQMKSGNEVILRYYDWPYEYAHGGALDLKGFRQVYAAVMALRSTNMK
jgi:hypothetical protein